MTHKADINECSPMDISEEDVVKAMKSMQGYIDITPADFREVYRLAYNLARQRLMTSLKAGDVMTAPVLLVEREMDLVAAAGLLADNNISGAPVVDAGGRIAGVVSEKDFVKKSGDIGTGSIMQIVAYCLRNRDCLARPLSRKTVGDIMTAPAITAAAAVPVAEIAALLMEKRINRLPIVDQNQKLIGIVTRSDLVNAYCTLTS